MNTTSASPAEPAEPAEPAGAAAAAADTPVRIRVWDAPVRLFHALMVLCFAGAWLTAESERWRLVHVTLGYTTAALVVFRLVWGLVGTRHARFASFVRGPRAVLAYGRGLLRGQPDHAVGHNPAGALAIVAMLGLALGVTGSGWLVDSDLGGEALAELHEALASTLLAVVGVHVAAVVGASLLLRHRLLAAMVSGFKTGPAAQGIRRNFAPLAALMLVAVLGFWGWQWQQAQHTPQLAQAQAQVQPVAGAAPGPAAAAGRDDDDD